MTIVCPKCQETLGSVVSTARLILTAHCPYCGHDSGVAVEPPTQAELSPASPDEPTSPTSKESVSQA